MKKSILLFYFQGENQGLLHCPYDAHHRVKAENLEEHIKLCRLRSAGFENISKKVMFKYDEHL